ncbi:hypothetical protein RHMOL_Rhmol13G0127500 [Rhododendron molle]|uniref:Uncharacterized protein n=1 Tax=Rhododendron molle TaxID=49168 RepID=A0ACC0L681_RHOML|nr:hypothetical protein RHMOL_Rhmol13G0127500 [Rhododendron molle]
MLVFCTVVVDIHGDCSGPGNGAWIAHRATVHRARTGRPPLHILHGVQGPRGVPSERRSEEEVYWGLSLSKGAEHARPRHPKAA